MPDTIRTWHAPGALDREAHTLLAKAPPPTRAARPAPAPSGPKPAPSPPHRREEPDLLGRLVGQVVRVALRSGDTVTGALLARTRYEMLVRCEDGLEILLEKHAVDSVAPLARR